MLPVSQLTPQNIIDLLDLQPLAFEGGYFRRTYYASERLPAGTLLPRYLPGERRFASAIYYLLTNDAGSFSSLHRLPTDEIYHFYLGDPVELLQLFEDGSSQHVILGQNLLAGQRVQYTAPRDVWQGSHLLPGGSFALLGTTMSPAFEDSDFEEGSCATLVQMVPHEAGLIKQLTRLE
jgi:uncharacterized protein